MADPFFTLFYFPRARFMIDESEGIAGPAGKGGSHRWCFRAVRPGAGAIELEYRRPREESTQPDRTFNLRVKVR